MKARVPLAKARGEFEFALRVVYPLADFERRLRAPK